MSDSSQPYGLQPPRHLCSWDSPAKNTGMDCHDLLQGIFLTRGSNPHLLHLPPWQVGSLPLVPRIVIGRTDAEAQAQTLMLWPPDAKNWLIWKDPDAGKDWRQKEKGTTEDEMVGCHHWLNGRKFEQAPRVGNGQWSLACLSPWGRKELDMTERLNWTVLEWVAYPFSSRSSQPRNRTEVSCIAGGFFTREALNWMETIWPTKPECLLSGPLQKQVCQLLANLCFSNLSTQRSRMGSIHKISNKVTGSTQGILLKHRFY